MGLSAAPTSATDLVSALPQKDLGRLQIIDLEGEMPIPSRRLVTPWHCLNTQQVELLSVSEIVPAPAKIEIWSPQGLQSKHIFIETARPLKIGDKYSGMVEPGNLYWHHFTHFR